MEEMQRAYFVRLSGMGCGTDSCDLLICLPSDLDECLKDLEWAHHEQWYEPDDDDEGIEPDECQAEASAIEYTPATMERLDCKRSGGGSFLSESGVLEVWQALGYGKPKFEGSNIWDTKIYVKDLNIPICQAGVSWQELGQWGKQQAACQDVIRVLDSMRHNLVPHLPPVLDTQLKGAYAMAENELKLIEANVQKVIARLKNL
jgi:hypothetical protein